MKASRQRQLDLRLRLRFAYPGAGLGVNIGIDVVHVGWLKGRGLPGAGVRVDVPGAAEMDVDLLAPLVNDGIERALAEHLAEALE